jgi:hypothetical protein
LTLPRKNGKGKIFQSLLLAPLVGLLYLYRTEGDRAATNCGLIQAQLAKIAIDPFESLIAAIAFPYDLIQITHLPFGLGISASFYIYVLDLLLYKKTLSKQRNVGSNSN